MPHAADRAEELPPAGRFGLVLQQLELAGPTGLDQPHEQLAAGDAVLDEGGARFMGGLSAAQRLGPSPGIQTASFGRRAVDVAGRAGPHTADPALQPPQKIELDQASQLASCPTRPGDRFRDGVEGTAAPAARQ